MSKKYATEEARRAARLMSKRRYYILNRNSEQEKSRERWRRRTRPPYTEKNKALFARLKSIWEETIEFYGGGENEYFSMNFRAKSVLGLLKPLVDISDIKESCHDALEAARHAKDIIDKFRLDALDADEEGRDLLVSGSDEAERTRLRWIVSEEEILRLTMGGLSQYEAAFRNGALTWQTR